MATAQVWTLIGLLATALFTLLVQLRGVEQSLSRRLENLTLEMHRGFGEVRGDIAVLRAQINREGP
jgi:hypothetical protein